MEKYKFSNFFFRQTDQTWSLRREKLTTIILKNRNFILRVLRHSDVSEVSNETITMLVNKSVISSQPKYCRWFCSSSFFFQIKTEKTAQNRQDDQSYGTAPTEKETE